MSVSSSTCAAIIREGKKAGWILKYTKSPKVMQRSRLESNITEDKGFGRKAFWDRDQKTGIEFLCLSFFLYNLGHPSWYHYSAMIKH